MTDTRFMRLALRLAKRGFGATSPNPMVGAVLVKGGKVIGRGWHRRAGEPHAEIEAIRDARRRHNNPKGATLYVTLEPCCTHGRTPPCTDAIAAAGVRRVVIGTTDPNPRHCGKAFGLLKRAGIATTRSEPKLAEECRRLNEAFNHWIVRRTPFVTVKAAMSLDGKIATVTGESRWITSAESRQHAMRLRQGADAIVVGLNTILADDPKLTVRRLQTSNFKLQIPNASKTPRRIVLDSMARTPLTAQVVSDEFAAATTIVVSKRAPKSRVQALNKRVTVWTSPLPRSGKAEPARLLDLRWLLKRLGSENINSLLVEGGGEVNASFLLGGFAHRIAFFYAPKILGGRAARTGVAGDGVGKLPDVLALRELRWQQIGPDLLLTANVQSKESLSCLKPDRPEN